MADKEKIQKEIETAINKLNNRGIKMHETPQEYDEVGLGDAMETILTNMGVTQERYKEWFNLEECNCTRRKQWLNKMLSWKRPKKE